MGHSELYRQPDLSLGCMTEYQIGNILPDSTAAPGLQAQQKELAKHMRQNSLEKQLQSRPNMQELVDKKILSPEEATASPEK